jgi:hypothetical protein
MSGFQRTSIPILFHNHRSRRARSTQPTLYTSKASEYAEPDASSVHKGENWNMGLFLQATTYIIDGAHGAPREYSSRRVQNRNPDPAEVYLPTVSWMITYKYITYNLGLAGTGRL